MALTGVDAMVGVGAWPSPGGARWRGALWSLGDGLALLLAPRVRSAGRLPKAAVENSRCSKGTLSLFSSRSDIRQEDQGMRFFEARRRLIAVPSYKSAFSLSNVHAEIDGSLYILQW